MKKVLSLMLASVIVLCAVVGTVSAGDTIFYTTFPTMQEVMTYFHEGNFFIPHGGSMLYGYADARAFQTRYPLNTSTRQMPTYDCAITIAAAEDVEAASEVRAIQLWYCNSGPRINGYTVEDNYIIFYYVIQGGENEHCFVLSTNDIYNANGGQSIILAVSEPYEDVDFISGTNFYNFGLSVGEGRIRGFFDHECVIDWVDTTGDYCVGDAPVGPIVFWNEGNEIYIKNFKLTKYASMFKKDMTVSGGKAPADNTSVGEFLLSASNISPASDTVTVDVMGNLKDGSMYSSNLNLAYDMSKLEFVECTNGDISGSYSHTAGAGGVNLAWNEGGKNKDNATYKGKSPNAPKGVEYGKNFKLATLTFKVKEGVELKEGDVFDFGLTVDSYNIPMATYKSALSSCTHGTTVNVADYSVGDVNNDSLYNLNDVVFILKHAAGYDLSGINKNAALAADVNRDGLANINDAVYYLKWLARWSGTTINGISY